MGNKISEMPLRIFGSFNSNCNAISNNFHWKISNFSLISINSGIDSEIFTTSNENDVRWKLILYVRKEYISIYLKLVDFNNRNIKVACQLSIDSNDGSEYGQSFNHCYHFRGEIWGVHKFITHGNLFKIIYLKKNVLCVTCKIKQCTNEVNSYSKSISYSNVGMENINENLSRDMKSLLVAEHFSDLCLEVDGVKFRVHKNILAARSPSFAVLFRNNMTKCQNNVIQIPKMKPDVMRSMLNFIYTGRIDDIEENAIELLQAADMYDLNELKLMCENLLCGSFTVDNVTNILHIAHMHNAQKLKNMAINFIKCNLLDMSKNPNFINFIGSKSCFMEIIQSVAAKNVN